MKNKYRDKNLKKMLALKAPTQITTAYRNFIYNCYVGGLSAEETLSVAISANPKIIKDFIG